MQSVGNTSKTNIDQYTLKMRFVPHREHDVHQIESPVLCNVIAVSCENRMDTSIDCDDKLLIMKC
jgi:hypothetical protein